MTSLSVQLPDEMLDVSLLSREKLINRYNVSRETAELLDRYAELLVDWQGRMNLVGPATLQDRWNRHFFDSAQLLDHAPQPGNRKLMWLDMGSGAGFPGLVMAIMRADIEMTLVESRQKKCQFLQAVAEACDCTDRVHVMAERLEHMAQKRFNVISARALANLTQLFDWGLRFSDRETVWILPKGSSAAAEVTDASEKFEFESVMQPSLTDPDARIVIARNVRRRKSR